MITRLGHYDIVEELGRGGMGVVYKGYESSLGRYVAIKVLSAQMAHDKVFVERFLREARAMATLNDAHIIQIYFIGQDEAQTFFVMEYIDGESLSTCLKRLGKLSVGDALKVLLHASQGLAAAHAQGVIHRDIKPGNIMVTSRGQVKVADFGIALANHDVTSKLTNTGAFVGTPGYLSPEVCMGKPVDQRSDIFALGIVLFEMLAGQMPFHDESPLKLMLDVVQAPTPDIRALNPEVDDEATRILEKMLAKDPAERYQDCEELNADLKRHPAVRDGGQLSFRPAPWAGANASNPTIVGAPTPLTPGIAARAATPPPVVSSRTPITGSGSATPAPVGATLVGSPPPPAPPRHVGRLVGLVVLFLGVCGLTWAYTSGKFASAPAAAVAAAVPANAPAPGGVAAAPAVPAPPATPLPPTPPPVQTGTDGATTEEAAALADAARVASGQAAADAVAVDAAAATGGAGAVDAEGNPIAGPVATVRYGHGGPNGPANRVRVRAVREPSAAELLAREEARRHNELAAQAAAEAAAAAQAPIEPVATAPAPTQAKAKKGFLCRVFKKCDPTPRRGARDAQAGQAAPPAPANDAATSR
jgi:serine/threonine-protein kinase